MMNRPEDVSGFPVFTVIGAPREMAGFIHGLRYPSLLVLLKVTARNSGPWLIRLDQTFSGIFKKQMEGKVPQASQECRNTIEKPVISLLFWMGRFCEAAGFPLFEEGKIIGIEEDTSAVMVLLPALASMHRMTEKILSRFLDIFNFASSGAELQGSLDALASMQEELRRNSADFRNMFFFLKVAFEKGIPRTVIETDTCLFGYGSRAGMLERTITDRTSVIGLHLARIKIMGYALLKRAGIPVPGQRVATTLETVLTAAGEFGFPVVLKSSLSESGTCITRALYTRDELRSAYASLSRTSESVIVEKYFNGRVYRFTVFQGKPLWIAEMDSFGLRVERRSSLRHPVERFKRGVLSGDDEPSVSEKLVPEADKIILSQNQGIEMERVPADGESLSLRKGSGVSGGRALASPHADIHPDNILLVSRVVSLLRLDLAEIDLMIPDINRSWMDAGAMICHFDVQPDLGGEDAIDLYDRVLSSLVQGDGRIPVALLVGAPEDWNFAGEIASILGEHGLVVGLSDPGGVTIGACRVHEHAGPYAAGLMLVMERKVDALLLCVNNTDLLSTGLPFERFDILVLAGSDFVVPPDMHGEEMIPLLHTVFDFLSPSCDGEIFVVSGSGLDLPENFLEFPYGLSKQVVDRGDAAHAVARAMLEAGKKHSE
ncbi:MAG: hypothetical protein HGA81_06140 [Chlorobium limicola]|nr:hypothetical protein [Chlorobium limicola]NTW10596.1 hypothetical protein [Chlorobiaceae bacterium]